MSQSPTPRAALPTAMANPAEPIRRGSNGIKFWINARTFLQVDISALGVDVLYAQTLRVGFP
jgi:hypothetical protein